MDDERNIKLKLGVLGILGIVYTSIGAAFLIATLGVLAVPNDEARMVMSITFGSMAAFWLCIGLPFLIIEMNKRKKVKDAFVNGRKIFAEYDHSSRNPYIKKVTGRPYNVYCKWVDENNKIHIFRSMDVDFNPHSMLQGKMIPVYVNPDNYNAYYVDLDCVLPMEDIHNHVL